jgi:hypothetical protein
LSELHHSRTRGSYFRLSRRKEVHINTLEYQVEGKPPLTLKAGNFFIQARAIHTAKNVGSGPGAELATHVVEKGKPLVVMAK